MSMASQRNHYVAKYKLKGLEYEDTTPLSPATIQQLIHTLSYQPYSLCATVRTASPIATLIHNHLGVPEISVARHLFVRDSILGYSKSYQPGTKNINSNTMLTFIEI